MSDSRKTIDARGLACPRPVILTKKALEEGGFDFLEVLVDNEAARENVIRFAGYSGHAVVSVSGEGSSIAILIDAKVSAAAPGRSAGASAASPGPEASPRAAAVPAPAAVPESPPEAAAAVGATVFLSSDRIGRGDDALGALLMRGFIYALAESEEPPARIILMNHGVRLATKGSEALDNLNRLAEAGVEVLACGTCLEFLGLKDSLAVGRVSNMYEIAGHLLRDRTLSM